MEAIIAQSQWTDTPFQILYNAELNHYHALLTKIYTVQKNY